MPVFRSADVCSLVSDIVRDSKSLFDSHGVECVLNFTEKECALVQTDPLLANIILQNFLQNAAKYSKKGGKVAVSLVRSGKNISVKVADEGIGIPYSEQQHIFEKLYRATNARSFEANGAGLGLYSCKMIAEKIKAGINFTSEEEKGSVFTVTFPIANTKKKGAAKKSAAKKRSKNTSKK